VRHIYFLKKKTNAPKKEKIFQKKIRKTPKSLYRDKSSSKPYMVTLLRKVSILLKRGHPAPRAYKNKKLTTPAKKLNQFLFLMFLTYKNKKS
jgi:hypothetical protein